MRLGLFVFAALWLVACGPSRSGGRGSLATDGGAEGRDGDVVAQDSNGPPPNPGPPGGPRFLSFSTNQRTTTGAAIVFTAVLTDPDGIDDLIGGMLVDPETEASYGSFQTSAAEGSYSMMLDWADIDVVRPLDEYAGFSRTFRARFFDVAGHVAEKDVSVTFSCDVDEDELEGMLVCGTACVHEARRQCGSCGRACGTNEQCVDRECVPATAFDDCISGDPFVSVASGRIEDYGANGSASYLCTGSGPNAFFAHRFDTAGNYTVRLTTSGFSAQFGFKPGPTSCEDTLSPSSNEFCSSFTDESGGTVAQTFIVPSGAEEFFWILARGTNPVGHFRIDITRE